MNLKLRINLIITIILALVMLLGALIMIGNAREDVRAEVDSTTILALHLLDTELMQHNTDIAWQRKDNKKQLPIFRLQNLNNIRHLRIEFFDALGKLRESNYAANRKNRDAPPAWFKKLMNTVTSSLKPTRRVVIVNKEILGEFVITPDPSYELEEIWDDTLDLFGLGALFFVLVNAVVYWAVNRALNPLSSLLNALTKLEKGHLETRLPTFSLPELSSVSSKFNAMAQTLENSISNNRRLTHQIIRLQEDERKNIAHDLHDEIGQHLTAINIDALTILKAQKLDTAHTSATAITEVAKQMMAILREMLQRLRPGTLYELGLPAALDELIDAWQQRNQHIKLILHIADQLDDLNETLAITAYRIVQECLTNISKHADAHTVSITIEKQANHLMVRIKDDGLGFDLNQITKGFGLAGMRERTEGLGGIFEITTQPSAGLQITARIPLNNRGISE